MPTVVRRSKRPVIRLIVSLIFALIGLVVLFWSVRRIERAYQKMRADEKSVGDYRALLEALGSVDRKALARNRLRLEKRFRDADRFSFLIGELTELARTHNLQVHRITPMEKSREVVRENLLAPYFERIPIELKLAGAYDDLADFLGALTELKNGILKIGQFSVNPSEHSERVLEFSADVFLYVERKREPKEEEPPLSAALEAPRHTVQSRYHDAERSPFEQVRRLTDEKFVLEGIVYDQASPFVLMGGEMKRVGDKIYGATILSIERDGVLFGRGEEKLRVRLKQG